MTEQELARLQALSDAATPPPWEAGEEEEYGTDIDGLSVTEDDFYGMGVLALDKFADAAFCCSARTAVPKLIAEVRRLRGEVRRLYDAMSEAGVSDD